MRGWEQVRGTGRIFIRRGVHLEESQGTRPKTDPVAQAKLKEVGLVLSLSGQATILFTGTHLAGLRPRDGPCKWVVLVA